MDAEDLVNHVLLAIGDGALMGGSNFLILPGKDGSVQTRTHIQVNSVNSSHKAKSDPV
jgi:hypothetical protein